jgi:hypothetical protein
VDAEFTGVRMLSAPGPGLFPPSKSRGIEEESLEFPVCRFQAARIE